MVTQHGGRGSRVKVEPQRQVSAIAFWNASPRYETLFFACVSGAVGAGMSRSETTSIVR